MSRVMYDSVTVGDIPTDAEAVALYIDGRFNNWNAGRRQARKAHHLSIAVFASDDAAALDVENGDATPAQVPGWVRRQLQREPHTRPVVYSSRDEMPQILAQLHAAGLNRSQVRLWSAHYGMGPHICSPRACGASFTADATQWTDQALGRNLDESLLADDFFPAKPKKKIRIPKPKVPTIHKKALGTGLAAGLATGILALIHSQGVHLTPAESGAIDAVAAILGAYIAPAGYIKATKH